MTDAKHRNRILFVLAGACLLGAIATTLVLARTAAPGTPDTAPAALPVNTHTLVLQDGFTVQRVFSGTVQAARESVVGFEAAGRLANVLVDEGATVEAGELLAELDTERLAAQRAERVAARSEAAVPVFRPGELRVRSACLADAVSAPDQDPS